MCMQVHFTCVAAAVKPAEETHAPVTKVDLSDTAAANFSNLDLARPGSPINNICELLRRPDEVIDEELHMANGRCGNR